MTENDTDIIHIAGPPITITGRVIQRCCVCGTKLYDSTEDEDFENFDYLVLEEVKLAPYGSFVVEYPGGRFEFFLAANLKDYSKLGCLKFVE